MTERPERIVAGIVTYDPDVELLDRNIRAIAGQVDAVIVFDNASTNVEDVRRAVRVVQNAELLESGENVGIATALNRIAQAAANLHCKWLVTLDQDSVCPAGMVDVLYAVADDQTPLVTPFIVDRKKLELEDYQRLDMPEVEYFTRAASKGAITSGALLNTDVLAAVGGFDDRYFIDYVDYDLNMRLLKAGYRIARANETYLLHQVGDAQATWLFTPRRSIDGRWRWERFYSFGHSEFRCYYKARNRIIYSKKYWRTIGLANEGIAQIPQQMALTLMFEPRRLSKLRAFMRGIRDGLRIRVTEDLPKTG
jgi:rhamnosyltransferase